MSNNLYPFSGPFTQWSQQSRIHVSQTVCSALLGVEQITEFEVTEENHFILVFLNFRQQAFLLLLNLALLVWLMKKGLGSWKGNISWIISTSSNDIFIYLYTYMFILFVNVFYCVFLKKMNPHYLLKHLHHDVLFYLLLDKRHYQTLLMCWTSILFRYFIIG